MNDDESGDELPIIDVRSPAERLTDSGRDGLARLRERLDDGPLDVAALIWMICVIGTLAVQIYGALDASFEGPFGESDGWITASLLAATGGYGVTLGAIAGIGLAAWTDSLRTRIALVLAAVGGAWAVVASLIGIAVIFHEEGPNGLGLTGLSDNRFAATIGQFMQAGLGVVVALLATSLLTARRVAPEDEFEIADLD